jgi:hypothetical protein
MNSGGIRPKEISTDSIHDTSWINSKKSNFQKTSSYTIYVTVNVVIWHEFPLVSSIWTNGDNFFRAGQKMCMSTYVRIIHYIGDDRDRVDVAVGPCRAAHLDE